MDAPASIAAQAMRTPTIVPANMRYGVYPGLQKWRWHILGRSVVYRGSARRLLRRAEWDPTQAWLAFLPFVGLVVFRIRRYVRGRSH